MNPSHFGDALASVNATLNTASFVLIAAGWVFIKRKQIAMHRRCMQAAVVTSALFLVSYVTRFALTGAHRINAAGPLKTAYLLILFSHMILAVVVLPLVLRSLYLGRKNRFEEHRRIARWAFPIWAYVSITGVVVYVLLYHVAGIAPG